MSLTSVQSSTTLTTQPVRGNHTPIVILNVGYRREEVTPREVWPNHRVPLCAMLVVTKDEPWSIRHHLENVGVANTLAMDVALFGFVDGDT
jgi:hypothetical protein